MSVRLYLEQSLEAPEVYAFGGGTLAAYTAPRPGREDKNEDGALCLELAGGGGVFAVADGAGGLPGGAQASGCALRAVAAALQKHEGSLREGILGGFDEANRAVMALGTGAATTLALVRFHEGTIRSYHVGDSLVLVVGQRGRRKLETIAHSPVGYALEAGMVSEAEALLHEDRHLVSNMVGAPDMRVEMSAPLNLAPRDTVLVASDGLSDNLRVDELVEAIRKGPLDKVAARLADAASGRMNTPRETRPSKPDDLTFLVYRP